MRLNPLMELQLRKDGIEKSKNRSTHICTLTFWQNWHYRAISNFTKPVSLVNVLLIYLNFHSHKIVHNILWSTVISHLYDPKLSTILLSIPRTGYLCILFYTLLFLPETANFIGLFKGTIFGFVDSTLCLHSKMLISVLICIYYIILNHSRWEFSICFQIIPDGVFFPNSSFRLYASLKEIALATYGDKFVFF